MCFTTILTFPTLKYIILTEFHYYHGFTCTYLHATHFTPLKDNNDTALSSGTPAAVECSQMSWRVQWLVLNSSGSGVTNVGNPRTLHWRLIVCGLVKQEGEFHKIFSTSQIAFLFPTPPRPFPIPLPMPSYPPPNLKPTHSNLLPHKSTSMVHSLPRSQSTSNDTNDTTMVWNHGGVK